MEMPVTLNFDKQNVNIPKAGEMSIFIFICHVFCFTRCQFYNMNVEMLIGNANSNAVKFTAAAAAAAANFNGFFRNG